MNLFVLAARKLGYFWVSFDQLFRTQALSRRKFFVRALGVFVYWFLLLLGIAGWCRLRSRNPDAALLFAAYAVVVTAMHLPFVMNTRIRAPLIEPALVILAGLALGVIARPIGMSPGLKTRRKKSERPLKFSRGRQSAELGTGRRFPLFACRE